MGAVARLEELKTAQAEYFAKERTRLQADSDFLRAVLAGRGGAVSVQDIATKRVGGVLIDSVSDYIGKPEGEE